MQDPTAEAPGKTGGVHRRLEWHLLIAAMSLALPWQARAQSRPDFSGEWTCVDTTAEQRSVAAVGDAAFRTGSIGTGWGSPLTLRQQGNQLIVEYTHFAVYDLQPPLRFAYALDGSESRNPLMIGHAEAMLRSRAQWRDSSLVISTTYPPVDGVSGTVEVQHALTLASPGMLVIETTRRSAGASTPPVRTLYRRN
jgi:hypothetical protein